MMRSLLPVTLIMSTLASAQIAPPKHESNFAHVKQARAENYSQRFEAIKCALVLISRAGSVGTGVFIGANGDIATASHVLGERTFKTASDGTFEAGINMPNSFNITDCHGKVTAVQSANVEKNGDAWGADLAVVRSGINTRDWLGMASNSTILPGEQLITMGFPGLAWGSLSIYTGIASTDDKLKLDSIVGFTTDTRQPVKPLNEFFQVEMPISPGLSGSPIIDNENRMVGIVTQAGTSTTNLDLLIQLNHLNAFAVPQAAPAPGQVTLNAFSLLAELVENLRNFASPGYGDVVPIRYLKRGQPQNQPPASVSH